MKGESGPVRAARNPEAVRPTTARPGATRERSGTVRARSRSRRPKVLIADPDSDVLESTAILVASLGYEPVPVDQPVDLLEIVEEVRPGLVLVETQFPGLNVAGFVAALRADEATASIPIAFFSAAKDLAAVATRHQVWASLAKPFAWRELAQLLHAALGPSPAMLAAGSERNLEREVRDSFREFRNLITALDNYIALLDKAPELSRPSRLAVQRLSGLALKMEAKAEHMRAFVLGLMLPEAEEPKAPKRGHSTRVRPVTASADAEAPADHP